MAVRFLIAFILVSCGASAQVFQTNNVPYKFRGLKADSMLVVPSGADTANLANPKWGESMTGALFAKTGDSTLWMKVGTRWVKVTGTSLDTTSLSNRINQKVDSVTSSNDSLYYYVNGTRYYVSSFTGFDTAVVVKAQVHNAESTTLLAGEVVYGFSSTGNLLSVKRANNKLESTSSKTFGIVRKDIPAGGIGWIVTNGVVDKLNLGAYTAGQEVYLDSIAGQFTATKPLAPYNMVFVGIIERANAGNGQLYVKIQNGFELYELHNVSARFPSNNQVLKFRASDSLWHNATDTGITSLTAGVGLTGGTITTTGTIAADTNVLSTRAWRQKGLDSLAALELSLNDTASMLNPYARGTGASNQVTFWNGTRSLSGSNNFTFNNRRVGIGTSLPVAQLNIQQPTIDSNLTAINVSGYNLTGSNAQSAVDISGTWNTTGTPTLIRANVTNTASNAASLLMDLQAGGVSQFRVSRAGVISGLALVVTGNINLGNGSTIYFPGTGVIEYDRTINSGTFLRIQNQASKSLTATSGNITELGIGATFAPTSGTAVFATKVISPTINQTGGANGITRGLYVNPTLTAAADWRSIEWSNNTGFGLYGAGSASNALAGPTTIGAAASPSASAVLDLTSTTRGFLPPRMTAAQRTGIANAAGLLVWDSDSARYMVNNGSAWRGLQYTGEASGAVSGSNTGTSTSGRVAFWTGTTSLGGSSNLFWDNSGKLGINTASPSWPLHVVQSNPLLLGFEVVNNGSAEFINTFEVNAPNATANQEPYFAFGRNRANNNQGSIGLFYAGNGSTSNRIDFNFYGQSLGIMSINANRQVSIGTTSPAASSILNVTSTTRGFLRPVQTSTQRNAISTPSEGLSIYNSTDKTNDVYDGTRWNNTPNGLKNSATLDFGSTAAQTSADLTITVTGAAEGDMVFLGTPNGAVNANTNFTAWVSATNTVTIRFNNYSSGAVDPASGTFKVYVIKN